MKENLSAEQRFQRRAAALLARLAKQGHPISVWDMYRSRGMIDPRTGEKYELLQFALALQAFLLVPARPENILHATCLPTICTLYTRKTK